MANPIFLAVDTTDLGKATHVAREAASHIGGIKLGLEFFLYHGRRGYDVMADLGLPIFLDLKLHDIPNTVKGGLRAVLGLQPKYLTVHAQGGAAMVAAAREQSEAMPGDSRTEIIAVTILTSLDQADINQMGVDGSVADQVARLGKVAVDAGADGLVCSPKEITTLRGLIGAEPTLIVPGIRPAGSATGDQKRVMTPPEALTAGASVLVIGRPISEADDPAAAAQAIAESLS